ncbi:uncharacterized protein ATNIH1004_011837 [Aspergillus tanneri]|uniref:Uncharacterized protein n=1 Tax=Aspergillus tanneri TaxID=1220188 RepID=A0A5M9M4S0_9EURO|nr:uncharacterized protein ATNIH1004_011837 [Aspergillus tanneri]KAA8641701.1 hypothetical protein ATNIH1004_011837 [Aspergillus tanneri]
MPPKGRRNTGGKRLPGQTAGKTASKSPSVLHVFKDNDDLNEAFIEQYKAWHVRAAEWVLEENGRTVDDYTSIEPAPVPDLSNEILPKSEREIRHYANQTGFLFPNLHLDALSEVTEISITHLFACSNKLTRHGKHASLMVEDMRLVLKIIQESSQSSQMILQLEEDSRRRALAYQNTTEQNTRHNSSYQDDTATQFCYEPSYIMVHDSDINSDEDPEFEGEMDLDKSESDLESSSNSSTEFGEQGDGEQSEGGQGDSER